MTELRDRAIALVGELLERLGPDTRDVELRNGDLRVRVSRPMPVVASAPRAAPPVGSAAAPSEVEAPAAGPTIVAPLTGIFYRSPSPQLPPFVQVGSVIAAGDVIGLIEAMKLFNEVKATAGGRVRRILVENGQLARKHQPLLELDP